MESRCTWTTKNSKRKIWRRRKTAHDPNITHLSDMVETMLRHGCGMAASDTGPLLFIDDVSVEWIMKCSLLRFSWSDRTSQCKQILTQSKRWKNYARQINGIFLNGKVSDLISVQWFKVVKLKTEGRRTHKQATTEGGCHKGLADHLNGGNSMWWCPWPLDFR